MFIGFFYVKIHSMLTFSGGYLPINANFVLGIKKDPITVDQALDGYLAIMKNIMFRCGTINPSPLLNKSFGPRKKYGRYFICKNSNQVPNWEHVIKGGSKTNPALQFYDVLKKEFPDAYLSFLPECPFSKIAPEASNIERSAVDFYSPFYKLVIEIDGGQHKKSTIKTTDKDRDSVLKEHGVQVVRIPSSNIHSNELKDYLLKIKSIIQKAKPVNNQETLDLHEASYLYAFRLQVAILEAISHGFLDVKATKCNIDIISPDNSLSKDVFFVALEDIKQMLQNLYALNKEEFKFPFVNLRLLRDHSQINANNLTIDVSIYEFYDQQVNHIPDNYIYIRNDYFIYPPRGLVDDVSQQKNYYNTYNSNFRFTDVKKDNEAQHVALLYFLKLLFNYSTFRSNQEDIVCSSFNPNNAVIGILPTGAGKSICYQFVGMLTPGLSVVVSPLKSLMEDQCANLFFDHSISAATFLSGKSTISQERLYFEKRCKFVYIAPERMFNAEFRKYFIKNTSDVGQIVVDEVHCLSEWGHDFRTSYLLLFNFFKQFGLSNNIYLIGTTATASLQVIDDIDVEFSKLNKSTVVIQSDRMYRPELKFGIYPAKSKGDKYKIIASTIRKNMDSGEQTVVFVPSTSKLEDIKALVPLNQNEENDIAVFYSKTPNQSELISKMQSGELKTLIATTAFGMGIDIKHIRHTIHYCIGSSVESLYQEMGRAGRDGKSADCYICFNKNIADYNLFQDHKTASGEFDFSTLNSYAELADRLTLLKVSNFPPELEVELAETIYETLLATDGTITCKEIEKSIDPILDKSNLQSYHKNSSKKNIIDKYLYKLYLLRLIDLWDITYSNDLENPTYSNIKPVERTNEEIGQALDSYVGLYEPGYKNDIAINIDNVFYRELALKTLCEWCFKNFFMYRWRSMETLYDMLYNFKNSRTFADRIDNYFSSNELLQAVSEDANVENFGNWFKVLRSGTNLKKLKDQLARYLESPSCVYGIKYISALVRLQLDEFESIEGKPRLKNVLDHIVNYQSSKLFVDLIIQSLKYLSKTKDKLKLLEYLSVNYSTLITSEDFVSKLQKIQKNKALLEYISLIDLNETLTEFNIAMEELNG